MYETSWQDVFNAYALPITAFAESFGLHTAPRMRFLHLPSENQKSMHVSSDDETNDIARTLQHPGSNSEGSPGSSDNEEEVNPRCAPVFSDVHANAFCLHLFPGADMVSPRPLPSVVLQSELSSEISEGRKELSRIRCYSAKLF